MTTYVCMFWVCGWWCACDSLHVFVLSFCASVILPFLCRCCCCCLPTAALTIAFLGWQDYIEYVVAVMRKMREYGISCFIDPHQDVWSRFTGGDGAPGWTLEVRS